MEKEEGFWATLFDFSFRRFAIPKLVPILYAMSIIFIVLLIILYLVIAFSENIWRGLLMLLVGAPLLFFACLIPCRLWLEVVVTLFRIREDLRGMKEKEEGEKAEG